MTLSWIISIYFIVWWTVLFAILPWGVKTHWEAGIEVPGGGDPASPVNPNLKRKFLTTTWVAAVIVALIWLAFFFNLVHLPNAPIRG